MRVGAPDVLGVPKAILRERSKIVSESSSDGRLKEDLPFLRGERSSFRAEGERDKESSKSSYSTGTTRAVSANDQGYRTEVELAYSEELAKSEKRESRHQLPVILVRKAEVRSDSRYRLRIPFEQTCWESSD